VRAPDRREREHRRCRNEADAVVRARPRALSQWTNLSSRAARRASPHVAMTCPLGTTSRSATRLACLDALHGHNLGGREVSTGGRPKPVAIAFAWPEHSTAGRSLSLVARCESAVAGTLTAAGRRKRERARPDVAASSECRGRLEGSSPCRVRAQRRRGRSCRRDRAGGTAWGRRPAGRRSTTPLPPHEVAARPCRALGRGARRGPRGRQR
jgi:hypothetical protein